MLAAAAAAGDAETEAELVTVEEAPMSLATVAVPVTVALAVVIEPDAALVGAALGMRLAGRALVPRTMAPPFVAVAGADDVAMLPLALTTEDVAPVADAVVLAGGEGGVEDAVATVTDEVVSFGVPPPPFPPGALSTHVSTITTSSPFPDGVRVMLHS